jgi:hypothetical protein
VGHIIRGGMDVIATLNKWQHLVNHIHYKDFSGNGAEPWAQMGTGKLDFHKITEWLVARNYSGWIICEDEAHVAVDDPDGVTKQNGQWCKDNLHPISLRCDREQDRVGACLGRIDFTEVNKGPTPTFGVICTGLPFSSST